MDPIADLLPPPGALADPKADAFIARLRQSFAARQPGEIEAAFSGWLERMAQAREKIEARTQIARPAELISLAQFGAGSAGRLAAIACEDEEAASVCERLFVGLFLVEIVGNPESLGFLVPRKTSKDGAAGSAAADSAPANEEILRRAAEALGPTAGIRHRGLRRHLLRRAALARRRIRKIRKYGPGDRRAAMSGFDRLVVSAKLFLRGERAS